MTSQKQTSLFTEEQLTYSRAVFRANPTQWPVNEKEKKMSDISGRRCSEQLKKFNRVGLWAKMFTDLLIGQTGWYSTKCKLTWKLRGTKYSRMYCQLAPSTLPTEGIEFGLLPTVNTTDWNTPFKEEQKVAYLKRRHEEGKMAYPSSFNQLRQMAYENMFPTPTAMDSTGATANMKSSQVKEGSMHSVTLSRWANTMLITPTASDGVRSGMKGETLMTAKENGNLAQQIAHQTGGGTSQLNPPFVLEMMGFPPDWTALPFLNGETNQSKQQGTQ